MDSRQQFEEKYPLPEGMYFDNEQNAYAGTKDFWLWCARLEAWQASRESVVIELPEITKDHIFFALNCHMEDPSDDEEDGFNAGVSWCRAFIKQQMAKSAQK